LRQESVIGGLVIGGVDPEQWGQPSRPADFFAVKADVESLLALSGPGRGDASPYRFVPASHPALHPGQTARIELDGCPVGLMGMLHPALAAELDLIGDAFLFEIEQSGLSTGVLPRFNPISRFPTIRRDIAIVVDEAIPYAAIAASVQSTASALLRDLVLFDVYGGATIEQGRKSLALGLILQASSQTLTDELVDEAIGRVIARLASEFGARLRD
jgi:phenylalanyl-tRNA synthetase beta chain